ncbi:MAG: hypothetical protein U1F27_01335 [Turneriella sp.]
MKKKTILICSGLLLFASACGKKTDAKSTGQKKPAGACHYVQEKYCNEYYGMADRKWVDEDNCKPANLKVLDKCPIEGAIKRCVFDSGTLQERHLLTYDVKADYYCKQPGVVEKTP